MIWNIARREWLSLFVSPLAWTLLGVVVFIVAWMFLSQLEAYLQIAHRFNAVQDAPGVTELVVTPVLGSLAVISLMIVPLLCMRSFAEERRSGSLNLLLAAPVSSVQIVLGKFLGLAGLLFILVLLILLMPLSLLLGGSLDLGRLAAASLGLLLMLSAFAAAGLYLSSLTTQPVVAAVSGFGLLLFLLLLDWAAGMGISGEEDALLRGLSLRAHYQQFLQGTVDTASLAFYLLFCLFFLGLTSRQVQRLRGQA